MPNNIEGRGLTDREMMQLCLELEKGRCRSVIHTMLECTHEELRNVYKECLDNASDSHQELFFTMKQRGWYKVEAAKPHQVHKVQELMQNNLHPDDQF